jgi:hypothetical protein
MAQWNDQLNDEVLVDGSVPINGINNTLPPNAIDPKLASKAINRLTAMDNLNRPRPGTIARMLAQGASMDSIHHLGVGQFLYNHASSWGIYDSRSNVNAVASGGPAWASGDQIYSALCDKVLYFTRGGNLYKYDTVAKTFGTNPIPSQYPTAAYPIWASNRLIYAYQNNLLVSDILDPEVWDVTNQSVTLDPITTDLITGQCVWQNQTVAVFRNGSTWIIATGPNLNVVDWEVNRASATIGCCCHGTIVQCGVEVFFLSETGRGVFALSQMPTSDQMGVWLPISAPIKMYMDRINWAAIKNARATFWNDLYMLSVPIDGSLFNNFIFIYSVTLNTWQGRWCFDIFNSDYGFRDSARDRTNPDATLLLVGTLDGVVSEFTYPTDRRYYDTDLNSVQNPVDSLLTTRSFTFSESLNQIQPHSAKLQFLESEEDVTITVIVDRTIEPITTVSATSGALLQLTIPGLPFDLDLTGFYYCPLSLLSIGICNELQIQIEGDGNWTIFQVKVAAWEAAPMMTI